MRRTFWPLPTVLSSETLGAAALHFLASLRFSRDDEVTCASAAWWLTCLASSLANVSATLRCRAASLRVPSALWIEGTAPVRRTGEGRASTSEADEAARMASGATAVRKRTMIEDVEKDVKLDRGEGEGEAMKMRRSRRERLGGHPLSCSSRCRGASCSRGDKGPQKVAAPPSCAREDNGARRGSRASVLERRERELDNAGCRC